MNTSATLIRESMVSTAINGAISIVFFVAVFGVSAPASVAALGRDCLPQAFMVSLMSGLVPPLLLRRSRGGGARPIIVRAVALAIAGGAIAGGAAYLACRSSAAMVPTAQALPLKTLFGACIGMIVTPISLVPLLRSPAAK